MFETVEIEKSELDGLAHELEVSQSMLRFWQEEFLIGGTKKRLTATDCDELRLVAQWSKVHQFKLDLVRADLEKHRKSRTEKQKMIEKLSDLRQFLAKIQGHL